MDHKNNNQNHLLEQIYVHDVYNRLSSTTLTQDTTAWPNVRKFLHRIASQHKHAFIADVGCGTGKYMKLKSDLFTVGCDYSHQLCELTRHKYAHIPVVIADNLHLPYRDNLFDGVISIGVIHHLSTHQRRLKAIQECLRILKPNGGQLLIYTWAMEQKQRKFSSQDVLIPCIHHHHQPRLDIIHDNNNNKYRLSSVDIEEEKQEENTSPSRFSMIESIQNLFQRFTKPSSPSSTSSPSTPNLSHDDKIRFRLRPFPMSSCHTNDNNEQPNLNPNNRRYYHVFQHGELEMLIEEASKTMCGSRIVKSYYDHGNWCVIVQKDVDSCTL